MATQKPAPKFLNLLRIKLPPGGVASIGHRVSGVLMFLAVPMVAWQFGLSLESPQGFEEAQRCRDSVLLFAISLLLVWSLSHHLLAGIRHLLLDIELGIDKLAARTSAWLVNIGALLMTALYLVWVL
jgi:succinate dehydrogenase / fumarate reductase cytochrome b subunit